MGEYRKQSLVSGWGRIWNSDRSKSVNVFYEYYTDEEYAGGGQYPVRMPDSLKVKGLDFRGEDKNKKIKMPDWFRHGAILESEDREFYAITQNTSDWYLTPLKASSSEQSR